MRSGSEKFSDIFCFFLRPEPLRPYYIFRDGKNDKKGQAAAAHAMNALRADLSVSPLSIPALFSSAPNSKCWVMFSRKK